LRWRSVRHVAVAVLGASSKRRGRCRAGAGGLVLKRRRVCVFDASGSRRRRCRRRGRWFVGVTSAFVLQSRSRRARDRCRCRKGWGPCELSSTRSVRQSPSSRGPLPHRNRIQRRPAVAARVRRRNSVGRHRVGASAESQIRLPSRSTRAVSSRQTRAVADSAGAASGGAHRASPGHTKPQERDLKSASSRDPARVGFPRLLSGRCLYDSATLSCLAGPRESAMADDGQKGARLLSARLQKT